MVEGRPAELGRSSHGRPAGLNEAEQRQLDLVRRFGTLGSLLMAVGAIGAGASPVVNPFQDFPVLNLFIRVGTVSMAAVYTGMGVMIVSWLWLGRFASPGRPRLVSRSQMDRTLMMWLVPLSLSLPMFSRDVYSYLAIGEMAARGLDPYTMGPAEALGVDHPLTRGVPNIWRDTPSPYGQVGLAIGRGIAALVGDHLMIGILLHRLLALAGIAMIVWALPRLARRFGVPPVAALWLGAANPLVMFHLVSGVHNEALAIGLMLAGFELALSRSVILGTVIITIAALVKLPAVLALGFLGAVLARRAGGELRDLLRVTVHLLIIFAVTLAALTLITGIGFGWIGALDVPNLVKTWKSPSTALGMAAGGIGILLGVGNHIDAAILIGRGLGYAATAVICAALLWIAFRTRQPGRNPLTALGIALGCVMLLGPVVHPWYMIWAAIPLAAATNSRRFRTAAIVLSIVLAVPDPPPGMTYEGRAYVIPLSIVAGLIVCALLVWAVRRHMPEPNNGRKRVLF